MRYGTKIRRTLSPGKHTIKIFKRDARSCRGRKLLQSTLTVADDGNVTAVLTRKAPQLVVFDNTGYLSRPSGYAFRHAADYGPLVFLSGTRGVVMPTAVPVFEKGAEWIEGARDGFRVIALSLPGIGEEPFLEQTIQALDRYRHEFIVVGTRVANTRLVKVFTPVTAP
jgi:hypothetical protein